MKHKEGPAAQSNGGTFTSFVQPVTRHFQMRTVPAEPPLQKKENPLEAKKAGAASRFAGARSPMRLESRHVARGRHQFLFALPVVQVLAFAYVEAVLPKHCVSEVLVELP